MTVSAWDSLLARARARRGLLCGDAPGYDPEPAPAHDLLIESIGKIRIKTRDNVPLMLPMGVSGSPLIDHFIGSIGLAVAAERFASSSGALRDRQLADDALDYALRVAGRVIEWRDAPRSDEGATHEH